MRVAIIGYGGVGRAFVQLLYDKKDYLNREGLQIQVNYIIGKNGGIFNSKGIDLKDLIEYGASERDITKYPSGGSNYVSFEKMLQNRDVDVVIELTPTNKETGEPAMTHIKKSLECGINVVTANKGPILLAYKELKTIAIKNSAILGIGCTTGGALPSINGGIIDLAGADILSIEGVLNGTSNFIINEMENSGCTYLDALKKAQQLGIAETDPSLDVEGWDTATKLVILTNVLMNEQKSLEDLSVEGITKITAEDVKKCLHEGKKYKLLGKAVKENGETHLTVGLEKLDRTHPLYGVDGKNKAVRYISDVLGDLTIIGGASGVIPAGASILRDLINIYRGYRF
ncbi:homoserine dehydrogenase [Clostridium omnivorum]|uniref:Homoserine dehydrogenase n=1 Tax=Clostridium omnivorum TaxID=1604902 RepID=A0ABQ5NBR8_9CLOT|nr:homoserine dehydrogenase [Clostridium sp. E14]GLC32642.1 homoserine dehydrogenase [Clostridium sp. E14]